MNPITVIENTSIYCGIASLRSGVEIWDDNYLEDGWAYFSIVARDPGAVRKLEYVRVKGNVVQLRSYDKNGDDLWSVIQ
jgi:hypothetical protein